MGIEPPSHGGGGDLLEREPGLVRVRAHGQRRPEGERDRPPPEPRPLREITAFRVGEQAAPEPVDRDRHERRLDLLEQPLEAALEAQELACSGNAPLAEDPHHVTVSESRLNRLEGRADRFRAGIEEDEAPLIGEHPHELPLDVGAVDHHADRPRAGQRQQKAVEPREMVGHHHDRTRLGHVGLVDHPEPPARVDDRRHHHADRGPRSAHHGRRRCQQRADAEQPEQTAGRYQGQRGVARPRRRPQPAVDQRGHEHPGKHEQVDRGQDRAAAGRRALLLHVGLQWHVKHPCADAEHGQPDNGRYEPPRRADLSGCGKHVAGRQGQGEAADRHHDRPHGHEAEIHPRALLDAPLRERAGDQAAQADAADQSHQQRHDLPLRRRPGFNGKLVDVELSDRSQRPEEDDARGGGQEFGGGPEFAKVAVGAGQRVDGGRGVGRRCRRRPQSQRRQPTGQGDANQGDRGGDRMAKRHACRARGERRDVGEPVAAGHPRERGGERDEGKDPVGLRELFGGHRLGDRPQDARRHQRRLNPDHRDRGQQEPEPCRQAQPRRSRGGAPAHRGGRPDGDQDLGKLCPHDHRPLRKPVGQPARQPGQHHEGQHEPGRPDREHQRRAGRAGGPLAEADHEPAEEVVVEDGEHPQREQRDKPAAGCRGGISRGRGRGCAVQGVAFKGAE